MTPEQPLPRPRLLVHPDGRWAIKTPSTSIWWVADDAPDRQPHATLTAPPDGDPAWTELGTCAQESPPMALSPDMLQAAHKAIHEALASAKAQGGSFAITPVGSPEWIAAPWQVQVASLAVTGLSALLSNEQSALSEARTAVNVTHGDAFTITELQLRLNRIATWHCRESAGGGLVGNYCVECRDRWPCDTYRMATEGRLPDAATC